jgi:rhamnosyl/mannosyltransferase
LVDAILPLWPGWIEQATNLANGVTTVVDIRRKQQGPINQNDIRFFESVIIDGRIYDTLSKIIWHDGLQHKVTNTPMVRVLHVYRTYFPDPAGGVQEAIRQICLSTAQFDVTNSVFCLSPNSHVSHTMQDPPVWRERSWMAPASCDIGGINALRQFTHLAHDHDLIHYHFPWPFADLMHFAARIRAKAVMTYHSDIVKQSILGRLYAPLMWKMLTSMDKIVATSPNYASSSKILSDPRVSSRVQIIPLGISDVGDNLQSSRHASIENDPYFLFVGALRYYKGIPTLLHAAKSVSARVVIAGEGACGAELRQLAARLGCSNVEFKGYVTDEEKFRLIQGCRAFVMPSDQRSEAFGVALIEAAMLGRPMITTELYTGTSFINKNMETGLVVPPRQPVALANAMNTLLHNSELASNFGANARVHYKNLFTESALGAAYNSLYRQVLTSHATTCASSDRQHS